MMNCNEIRQNLALLVGDDLEDEQTLDARRHLAECPGCRQTLQSLEDSQTAMRVVSETPEDFHHESLWPSVRAQLMPATLMNPSQPMPNWVPTAALAAACLALLLFVGSTPMLDNSTIAGIPADSDFQFHVTQPVSPLAPLGSDDQNQSPRPNSSSVPYPHDQGIMLKSLSGQEDLLKNHTNYLGLE